MTGEVPSFQKTNVIECPSREYEPRAYNLFLAGGITNCPDWQSYLIQKLNHFPQLNIFNPRREEFPIDDLNAVDEQISWEYEMLKNANMISVWFSRGSLNPIVLYELGMWVNSRPGVRAFVGVDPEYQRAKDVCVQTKLARPEIVIVPSLDELADQISSFIR